MFKNEYDDEMERRYPHIKEIKKNLDILTRAEKVELYFLLKEEKDPQQ